MNVKNKTGFYLNISGFFCMCLFLSAIVFFAIPAKDACAQIAPTPCDPDYYQSLEQRAWLEAQREITQNQNLITKPDSVLAYTCFDRYLLELADHAQEMFSETTRWGASVLGADQDRSMNDALEDLVQEALIAYLDANFIAPGDLRMLGGRTTTTRNTIPATINNGGSYSCNLMQLVWLEAKCYNFQNEPDDGFFTFENYQTTPDKRAFPTRCGGTAPAGGLDTVYETARQEAGLDIATGPPWPIDDTFTYLDRFDPTYDPGTTGDCGTFVPVPTGVQVRRIQQTPNNYPERVCIMAGCHYQPGGLGANRCFP